MSQVQQIVDVTNEAFVNKYASAGMIGLVGGTQLIDKGIRKLQKELLPNKQESLWSHAFLFSGERHDGHHWVIESDIDIQHKQVRMGVQENRASKYFDEKNYPNLAILDFELSPEQVKQVLAEALHLLANNTKYSLLELVGTFLNFKKPELRKEKNLFARNESFYCTAMVSHCYSKAGISILDNIDIKNSTPQDIAETKHFKQFYYMKR